MVKRPQVLRSRVWGCRVGPAVVRPLPDRHGQGLVEFALVLPVFLLIFSVVVDLGRLIHAHLRVGQILDDAARYATTRTPTSNVHPSAAQVRDRIDARFRSEMGGAPYSLEQTPRTRSGIDAVELRLSTRIVAYGLVPGLLGRSDLSVSSRVWYPKP